MIRPPPKSPPFPPPALFRSAAAPETASRAVLEGCVPAGAVTVTRTGPTGMKSSIGALHVAALVRLTRCRMSRSEEHTSELQSPCNLVCRLLLEKKKHKKQHTYHTSRQHSHLMCQLLHDSRPPISGIQVYRQLCAYISGITQCHHSSILYLGIDA